MFFSRGGKLYLLRCKYGNLGLETTVNARLRIQIISFLNYQLGSL